MFLSYKLLMSSSKTIRRVAMLFLIMGLALLWFTSAVTLEKEENDPLDQDNASDEIINPHFTGKDCDICHEKTTGPGRKGPRLRFGGDDVAMCNSCHQAEYVKADIHPVGIVPSKGESVRVPAELPLYEGEVTCRSCHDVYLQCRENPAVRLKNKNFLRGAPYKKNMDICFRCHNREVYKKTNPHPQVDKKGRVVKERCLYCHQSLPDPGSVSGMGDVNFQAETSTFCKACHMEVDAFHPARANHILTLPREMQTAIKESERQLGVILPLLQGRVFCWTCHNPHEKGVIQREEAKKGAGEEYFLRLDRGYDLCVSCHMDKSLKGESEAVQSEEDFEYRAAKILSSHKPMEENKCKKCHAVTPENMGKPGAISLCFKEGCHKPDIIEKEFVHEKEVVENCYLCHRAHVSVYKKLLKNSEEKLCYACHPLLRDKNNESSDITVLQETVIEADNMTEEQESSIDQSRDNETSHRSEEPKGDERHKTYMKYLRNAPVAEGNECGFCHSSKHKAEIEQLNLNIQVCSDCHTYVRSVSLSASAVPRNVHQVFQEKLCSVCHDPHAAQNRYLLKKTPEYYFSVDFSDSYSPSPSSPPSSPLEQTNR